MKHEKICWRYHHLTHKYQNSQSYDVRFLRYSVRQTEFFVILSHFLPFYHLPWCENQNFEKKKKEKEKKCLEILSFYTYMCTINEDLIIYGSWNIRCNRQEFFSFWAIFALSAPWQPRKSKFKNWKKHLQVLSFYTFAPQWCMVPETWSATDIIFSHSKLFFAFTPCGSRKSKFWKNEKTTQDIILQMCTINDSHMMYGSSGMECNKQNFMSF